MNVDFQIIGKRIKERRKKLHLSQEKLAEMVDKSTVFISNLENGKRGASVESVIMICDTLGLSLDELLVGTVPEGTDRYLDMIATVFQQCTETEKRLISEVVIILFDVMEKYHYRDFAKKIKNPENHKL